MVVLQFHQHLYQWLYATSRYPKGLLLIAREGDPDNLLYCVLAEFYRNPDMEIIIAVFAFKKS